MAFHRTIAFILWSCSRRQGKKKAQLSVTTLRGDSASVARFIWKQRDV